MKRMYYNDIRKYLSLDNIVEFITTPTPVEAESIKDYIQNKETIEPTIYDKHILKHLNSTKKENYTTITLTNINIKLILGSNKVKETYQNQFPEGTTLMELYDNTGSINIFWPGENGSIRNYSTVALKDNLLSGDSVKIALLTHYFPRKSSWIIDIVKDENSYKRRQKQKEVEKEETNPIITFWPELSHR